MEREREKRREEKEEREEEEEQDEEEEEVEEEDGGVAELVATEKVTKHEAYRRAHLAHLQPLPQEAKGSVRLDRHDPDAFEVLQIGRASDTDWSGTPAEQMRGAERTKDVLRHILAGYKRQGDLMWHAGDVTSQTKARHVRRLDVDRELEAILAGMKANTRAALGFGQFNLDNILANMAAFTADDLKGWLVYVGWVKYKDGTLKCYGGSAPEVKGTMNLNEHDPNASGVL